MCAVCVVCIYAVSVCACRNLHHICVSVLSSVLVHLPLLKQNTRNQVTDRESKSIYLAVSSYLWFVFPACWECKQGLGHGSLCSTPETRDVCEQEADLLHGQGLPAKLCVVEGTTQGQNKLASAGLSTLGAPPSPPKVTRGNLINTQFGN